MRIDAYNAENELTFSQTVEDPTRRIIEHPADSNDGRMARTLIEQESGGLFLRILIASFFVTFVFSASAQTPELRQLKDAGARANTINMVFLGDGYMAAEKETYFDQCTVRMNIILEDAAMAPFADLVNVSAIFTESNESGTTIPNENITKDPYFKASYVDSPNARLVYVADNTGRERIFSVLADNVAEYDYVALLVNSTR